MDPIKEAFAKVKQDMDSLKQDIEYLKYSIEEIKRTLIPTQPQISPTTQQIIPTHLETPTDNYPLEAVKSHYTDISTGNRGVPTDRQTDRQTNRHIPENTPKEAPKEPKVDKIGQIERVSQVLESLDSIKKDLRTKFKKLTSQEMLIFSTIYQYEEQGLTVDYPFLAEKLNLSESSVRDYVFKIVKKGIPVVKSKENNKKVILSIYPELRKIASLNTLQALREL